jgi:hypothetical protein
MRGSIDGAELGGTLGGRDLTTFIADRFSSPVLARCGCPSRSRRGHSCCNGTPVRRTYAVSSGGRIVMRTKGIAVPKARRRVSRTGWK